jgi:hypothetical protein
MNPVSNHRDGVFFLLDMGDCMHKGKIDAHGAADALATGLAVFRKLGAYSLLLVLAKKNKTRSPHIDE